MPFYRTLAVVLALAGAGCMTRDPYTRAEKVSQTAQQGLAGAGTGAGLGALSAVLNGQNVWEGAIGGGLSGGVQGLISGAAMDRFEAGLLKEFETVGIKATPRGQNIILEIGDGIRFAQNSTVPEEGAARKLQAVGAILARYQRNVVDIVGHTSVDEPTALAGQRAAAVRSLLARRGIAPGRLRLSAKGATEPLRSNDAESTRGINRRVDIFIAPLT